MNLTDITAAYQLSIQLAQIDAKIAGAANVQILVSGRPVPDDLFQQLLSTGLPLVASYFSADRVAVVTKLTNLGVTV